MTEQSQRLRNAGFVTFFLSGICGIGSGVAVSLLQERYGFDYSLTGTLLSVMSVGNLLAGFLMGVLPESLGMKRSALLLATGYALGYGLMGLSGVTAVLAAAFFLLGLAKGGAINTCTVLVSDSCADRTRGMNTMHGCYACGALLCPFLIAAAGRVSFRLAVWIPAALGLVMWMVYLRSPMAGRESREKQKLDLGFLRSRKFWLLTGLLFFQNAAETGVTGWLVTYFKDSGILSQALAPYTVTVMWTATLIARLLIAFVFPFRRPRRAMVGMGALCTVFYLGLMGAKSQGAALGLLFAFAFSMAGMNPTAVASAGRMTSVTSMGVMLPVASVGQIAMPWIVGLVAQGAGLNAGMAAIIAPCVGLVIFAVLVARLPDEDP